MEVRVDTKTLKVRELETTLVPQTLLDKHVVKNPITEIKVKKLSEQKWNYHTNTVFEILDNYLIKCQVIGENSCFKEDSILFVSPQKLKTFQCVRYSSVPAEYRITDLGENYAIFEESYHFKSAALYQIEEILFQ